MQNRSLEDKIQTSFAKIMEYMMRCKDKVYLSFSGGKDSTVLADLAARVCALLGKKLILVFSNTGLEYPEIVQFAKSFPDWLRNKYQIEVEFVMLRPEMSFKQVIDKFGYPVISKEIAERLHYAQKGSEWAIVEMSGKPYYKCSNPEFKKSYKKYQYLIDAPFKISHRCCEIMKKKPFKKYEKETGNHPMVATMAEESQLRKSQWLKTGCNSFNGKRTMGRPMSFWREQDVLQYIKECELPYASVYGDIVEENGILRTTKCDRTGCIFCAFGYQLEHEPTRFDKLQITHPKLYEYCIGGGKYVWKGTAYTSNNKPREIPWINDDGSSMTDEQIEQFIKENKDKPDFKFEKVWQPNKEGLGLGKVLDYIGIKHD